MNERYVYHTSSAISGGHCGFGSYPDFEEEQDLLAQGWSLEVEDEFELIPQTGEYLQFREWVAYR